MLILIKVVSISDRSEVISLLVLGEQKAIESDLDLECPQSPRRRPSVKGPASKRLSGRPPMQSSPSLKSNKHSFDSFEFSDERDTSHKHHSGHRHLEQLIDQVSEWIKEERTKHADKKSKYRQSDGSSESKDRPVADDDAA